MGVCLYTELLSTWCIHLGKKQFNDEVSSDGGFSIFFSSGMQMFYVNE